MLSELERQRRLLLERVNRAGCRRAYRAKPTSAARSRRLSAHVHGADRGRPPRSADRATAAVSAGTILVFDKAYIALTWFTALTAAGVYFVTRLKRNTIYTVIEERTPPRHRGIVADQIIQFSGRAPRRRPRACAAWCWRWTTAGSWSSYQPPDLGGVHGRRDLQRALADRALLQSRETALAREDVCGHVGQCPPHPDLDRVDQPVTAQILQLKARSAGRCRTSWPCSG